MLKQIVFLAAALAVVEPAAAQTRERDQIPDPYKWDLSPLYASDDAWRAAKDAFIKKVPTASQFQGTLSKSPAQLLSAMDTLANLNKELARLYVYAALKSDQDTRVEQYQAMKKEISQINANFNAETAYVEPEILKIDRARVDRFVKDEPKLRVYRQYLDDILRRQAHTGTESEEKLIAAAGLVADAPSDTYGIFSDADFPFPTLTLSDGKTVKIDKASFNVYRALPNRDDRRNTMDTYFGALGKYRATFGSTLNGQVQRNIFYMKARKYPSTVAAALDGPNVPVSVYMKLIEGVNANLDTFHRYLRLRKRILGVDQLHYYDLYAPLVENVKLEYSIDEAQKNIIAALAPLGTEYTSTLERAFRERWIDLYPNPGKRAGAYSQGSAYDVHPFMLINYNGQYNDMSTVAHELGHTMQSYFSNKNQPYPTAGYPIFVAEVASTFNEALLINYMLKQISDDKSRLSLLGNYLENIKGTMFRQTQLAEMELRANEMAEKGQPLTGEALDKLYLEITRRYYGHDKGVCIVDDSIAHEWANIPHLYYNYYVYQYATSFTASAALSEKVMAGDKAATQKYLTFISAGGSKYPIDLLKDAGVDMTTSEPLDLTMRKMNRVIDEMEAILTKMGK